MNIPFQAVCTHTGEFLKKHLLEVDGSKPLHSVAKLFARNPPPPPPTELMQLLGAKHPLVVSCSDHCASTNTKSNPRDPPEYLLFHAVCSLSNLVMHHHALSQFHFQPHYHFVCIILLILSALYLPHAHPLFVVVCFVKQCCCCDYLCEFTCKHNVQVSIFTMAITTSLHLYLSRI